jgi:hypothetical protein
LQAIRHARFLASLGNGNAEHLAAAKSALDTIGSRVDVGEAWVVTEHTAMARGLLIYDQLTAREPYHCFVAARAKM